MPAVGHTTAVQILQETANIKLATVCKSSSIAFVATLTASPGQPAAESPAQTPASVEYSSGKASTTRPFSEVVRVGNMLYLSGKLGTDSSGKLAPGGIAAETRQTLENIKTALESNRSSLDHVVKCTVMLRGHERLRRDEFGIHHILQERTASLREARLAPPAWP